MDINGKFTPDKVTDVSSSATKGDFNYVLQLNITFSNSVIPFCH